MGDMRNLIHALLILGTGGSVVSHTHAQAPPQMFEVASIKPVVGEPPLGGGSDAPDRYDDPDTTLHFLIRVAYDLFDYQVVGGPDWIDARRWAVSAKAPAPMSRAAMRPLMRKLLEDRFALKAHLETRDMPVYELVMARSDRRLGPKIKPAAVDCTPFLSGQRPMAESPRQPGVPVEVCSVGASIAPGGVLTPRLNGQPLSGLIEQLEASLQRRVIDKTGLTGLYDIALSYVDDRFAAGVSAADGPALFTALQEQLGMKLESARGPVEVLVVDSAMEPVAN